MANGIVRVLGSILPEPSLWQKVAVVDENSICTVAKLQIAKDGLLVSSVHGLFHSQC
ncbi:MAG: hypothetical protein P4K94_10865 [Terracidiphilus sp.]|nr:hypothetical protein [Terracidiphilus sp.]